jgi:hypothetical protein
MDEVEINPSAAVPAAPETQASPGGQENVSSVSSLREIVKQATGRDYATDEAAFAGVKNTYAMVGKPAEQKVELPSEIVAKLAEIDGIKAELTQQGFYQQHPEYNTPAAKALISAMGSEPAKVVESEAFKLAFTAINAQAEVEKTKSVLHSSPRLGQATDKMTQAKELVASNPDAAAKLATASVLEAYDMK